MPELPQPADHECLACFLHRAICAVGCDCTHRLLTSYRDACVPRATALARKMQLLGGYCDCEVLANALRPITREAEQAWEADAPLVCKGVRRGTIQPCTNWLLRRGVQWGGGQFRRRAGA